MQKNILNIPRTKTYGKSSRCLPLFVAYDAFSLRTDMLYNIPLSNLDRHEKTIFNYRLSRARRIVKNAFGILALRFGIYHTQINTKSIDIYIY